MSHRAGHDNLTGLANRHGLSVFVDSLLAQLKSDPSAILFIDLDT